MMQNIVVFFIILIGFASGENVKGKYTGLPTQPHESILLEYKPKLNFLKQQIQKDAEDLQKLAVMVQTLIQKNVVTAKNIAGEKIQLAKKVIAKAKDEAKYSPVSIRMCINRQELEIPKLYTPPPMHCYINYTDMLNVKGKMVRLHLMVSTLYNNCHQIYMEDNEKDINLFKSCINERVMEVNLNISKLKDEFNTAVLNVINNSIQCLIEGNFEVFKSIGEIFNGLRNCKNMQCLNNYKTK